VFEGRTQLVYKPYDANGCEDMALKRMMSEINLFSPHNSYYVITRPECQRKTSSASN